MLMTPALLALLWAAQPPNLPPVVRSYAMDLTYYYRAPNPDLGPRFLKDLLKKENLEHPWFADRADVLELFAYQLADIARGKPAVVRAYEAEFAAAPPAGRAIIVTVLKE